MDNKRKRSYFVAANWKSNGTTHFVKDIVNNLINSLEYDHSKIGNILNDTQLYRLDLATRCSPHIACLSNGNWQGIGWCLEFVRYKFAEGNCQGF